MYGCVVCSTALSDSEAVDPAGGIQIRSIGTASCSHVAYVYVYIAIRALPNSNRIQWSIKQVQVQDRLVSSLVFGSLAELT